MKQQKGKNKRTVEKKSSNCQEKLELKISLMCVWYQPEFGSRKPLAYAQRKDKQLEDSGGHVRQEKASIVRHLLRSGEHGAGV